MTNSQRVTQALNAVLGEDIGSLSVARQYFSDKYIQVVDGKQIDFNEFIAHLQVLKQATESIVITIKSIAEGDGCVHTQHLAKATKKDGSISEFEVFACFQIEDGKIIRCEEMTRMIKGSSQDEDLGSRT
ncbi:MULTISPECIES: nuclear transport factor 2 family protein [Providencia]|uniref:Nuclear transport factor 2 family protein n=1 Tax=Providencia huaxiensis TaxID=2027290 RepID=A0ABU2IWT2_9GAMM|nr:MULTISPECIES: nuclear transport factor 2 family protein [Providencia]MBZ3680790.1 nuclear transport factor 2 family protein [Providencia rettgeri]AXH61202.1 nuclear transport factor 2 family protein [Providencia huaxiensis]MBQ0535215.1 nuclear transport factor 2 family protein [Providencia huaxiensis]MBQ0587121.1 nuclear transport factor 2 family protein [Providencia huaxiensis]MDI7238142.1 nuclear transport factor 2 family protein [Providencia huaxiensis]